MVSLCPMIVIHCRRYRDREELLLWEVPAKEIKWKLVVSWQLFFKISPAIDDHILIKKLTWISLPNFFYAYFEINDNSKSKEQRRKYNVNSHVIKNACRRNNETYCSVDATWTCCISIAIIIVVIFKILVAIFTLNITSFTCIRVRVYLECCNYDCNNRNLLLFCMAQAHEKSMGCQGEAKSMAHT